MHLFDLLVVIVAERRSDVERRIRVTSPTVCNVTLRRSLRCPETELKRSSLDNRLLCPLQRQVGFYMLRHLFLVPLLSVLSRLAMQTHSIQLFVGTFCPCICPLSFLCLLLLLLPLWLLLLLLRTSGGCTSLKFREPTEDVIASIEVGDSPFEQGVF
jgi:hypothetical protein